MPLAIFIVFLCIQVFVPVEEGGDKEVLPSTIRDEHTNKNFSKVLITWQIRTITISQSHSTEPASDFPNLIHLAETKSGWFKKMFM